MAPRFTQNVFQTYDMTGKVVSTLRENVRTSALVCFAKPEESVIFPFRDQLLDRVVDMIGGIAECYVHREQGAPTAVDSSIWLFSRADESRARQFVSTKSPGLLALIFRTRGWRLWKQEYRAILALTLLDMETSHDHPCIELYSSMHSENEVASLVSDTATGLGVPMRRIFTLPDMNAVIMSNAHYDFAPEFGFRTVAMSEAEVREMVRGDRDFRLRTTADGAVTATCKPCGQALSMVEQGEMLWFRCPQCYQISCYPVENLARDAQLARKDGQPFEYELFFIPEDELPPGIEPPFPDA